MAIKGRKHNMITIVNGSSHNLIGKCYYEPCRDDCTLMVTFIIHTVIGEGICILGLVGNALSFAVLKRDKQSQVSFLLQALVFVAQMVTIWMTIIIATIT